MKNPFDFMCRRANSDGSSSLDAQGAVHAGQESGEKMREQGNETESNVDSDCDVDEDASWALRIVTAIALTLCAVWLFSCLHPFVKLILETDGTSRVMAWVLFAVPAALIFACFVYVVWGYLHLPKIVRYSRKKYVGKESKLVWLLSRRYVSRIQGPKGAYEALIGEDAAEELVKLRGTSIVNTLIWLEQFDKYQSALYKQAEREISKFSTRIGASTIVSQMRATDMIVVVVLSAMMLLKLARIYNQRMSIMSALRLALRWGVNVYVAGESQAFSQKLAKGILNFTGKTVAAAGNVIPVPGAPALGAGAAKMCDMASGAVGIAAEFAINKILARKLGVFAHKQLQALID